RGEGTGDVLTRVLGVAEAGRQRIAGPRAPCRLAVDDQRDDGVVVRRGRELDLPTLGQAAPGGQHRSGRAAHQRDQGALVILVEIATLGVETLNFRVVFAGGEAQPGEEKQALQVAQLTGREATTPVGDHLWRRVFAALGEKLGVAGPDRDATVA